VRPHRDLTEKFVQQRGRRVLVRCGEHRPQVAGPVPQEFGAGVVELLGEEVEPGQQRAQLVEVASGAFTNATACGSCRSGDTVTVGTGPGRNPLVITDPTLVRIGEAVQLGHQGDRESARRLFAEIWDEIGGEQGDPLHVCTLAHSMADMQDDVRQELVWDQRALVAAGLLTDARVAQAGVPLSVAGLYPSLHLNLSECYRKLGDLDRAREHLQQARDTIGALGDDEYGQLIRQGLEQVAEGLS
jgi:hypothetical protein